ncbi:MAG: amino acid ABC transporter substrate-binding protein [Azospirillaceae bacterium]
MKAERFLGAAIATSAIALTSSLAAAQEPVRIGYSISQTGIFADAAVSQQTAYELWQSEVNAEGGLLVDGERRPVEFVVYDDQSDQGQAVRIYESLITDDEVDLLAAPWGTALHFPIVGVLERYQFPVVGNTAASVQLQEVAPGNIWFPTSAIPDRIAARLVEIIQENGYSRVAVMALQLPFSLEVYEYVVPALEDAGIEIVVDETFPPGTNDITAMLVQAQNAQADAILSLTYPGESVMYMNQAREVGIEAPFQFVLVGPTIAFFSQIFGEGANGIVTIGHWSPNRDDWPGARAFFDNYTETFGFPPDYLDSVLAYMSMEILEQAVAEAGLDHDALREAISTGTFQTINGDIAFDGVQNATTPTMLLQLQGGVAEIVWPPVEATADYQPIGE